VIISIDPGLEYFAAAKWDKNGVFLGANFYDIPTTQNDIGKRAVTTAQLFSGVFDDLLRNECNVVVFERPVVYPKSKAPPMDILALYGAVTAMATVVDMRFVRAEFVEPRKWKGNVPKAVFGKRIESRLTPKEQKLAQLDRFPKTQRHDVVDAIGIGLWWLGRMR